MKIVQQLTMIHKRVYRFCLFLFFIVFSLLINGRIFADNEWICLKTPELPHRFVKDVAVDKEFIWFGTAYGVAKYSKRENKVIKSYTTTDGLPDNFIKCIAIDEKYIWFGTTKGLSRLKKENETFVNYTKKDGLADDFVNDVIVDGNHLWIATKRWGINRYDKEANIWKNYTILQGLADNRVNCLVLDGNFIWAGTESGLSVYDKSIDFWNSYGEEDGLPAAGLAIKSVAVEGQQVWCGTLGGALALYDNYAGRFKVYTTDMGVADDNILDVCLDGAYLWVGTFSGVSLFDRFSKQWRTYTSLKSGLSEDSISAMEVDGNYIWIGTDGEGVCRFDKGIPEASLSSFSFYSVPGKEISLIGTAFDYNGIKEYVLEYKSSVAATPQWQKAGMSTVKEGNTVNVVLGKWNIKNLLNLNYDVRLTVVDKDNNKNYSTMSFVIDTIPPKINVEIPEAVREGTLSIFGRFSEANIKSIHIMPEGIMAKLNIQLQKFNALLNLRKGINNLRIRAIDIANQTNDYKIYKVVFDKKAPVFSIKNQTETVSKPEHILTGNIIDLSLKKVIINPGRLNADLEKVRENEFKFSKDVRLQGGRNDFEIIAYDSANYKSTYNKIIIYDSTRPSVTVPSDNIKVSKEKYKLEGEWYDTDLESIKVGDIKATIDFAKKTFFANILLKEGENLITIIAKDKEGNTSLPLVIAIVFSRTVSKLSIDSVPKYTPLAKLTLNGRFTDPDIKKITIEPGDIRATIDYDNRKFKSFVNLKEGENNFTVIMEDKFGVMTRRKVKTVLDTASPEITLLELPDIVNKNKLNLRGKYIETNLSTITVNGKKVNIYKSKKEFNIILSMEEGENQLQIEAIDLADNKATIKRAVNYIPQNIGLDATSDVDSEYAKQLEKQVNNLRDELDKLRKENLEIKAMKLDDSLRTSSLDESPATSKASVATEDSVSPETSGAVKEVIKYVERKSAVIEVPNKSAFIFVPYDIDNGDSLWKISKTYLGSANRIAEITCYNDDIDPKEIKKRKKILLPTKQLLFSVMKFSKDKIVLDVISALAGSYNSLGLGAKFKSLKKELMKRLVKKGLLPTSYINKDIKNINIRDTVILDLSGNDKFDTDGLKNQLARNNLKGVISVVLRENYLELFTIAQ